VAVAWQLKTARMDFVRISKTHLDDLVRLDSDPEVMRFISGGEPTDRQDYIDDLLPRMMEFQHRPYGFVAAYERDEFVGWFHLRPSVADPTVLELGYRLRREAWGRGLASEGARALVDYAFDVLDRTCVDACTDPRNAASIRVMEKCGMEHVGRFMHPRVPLVVVRYLVKRPGRRAPDGATRG